MQPKAHEQRSHIRDDASLLRDIQRGDETALEELYDRHSTAVYSLVLRILADRGAAADVLSDVFWRIWKRPESHDPSRASVIAWMMTIARRRAIDEWRMSGRRERHERSPEASVGTLQGERPSPEGATLAAEARQHVRDALSALAPEQRTPIELAFFEGLTHVEIAAQLQQPLGTIKTRIRAGMQRMREQMVPYFDQSGA